MYTISLIPAFSVYYKIPWSYYDVIIYLFIYTLILITAKLVQTTSSITLCIVLTVNLYVHFRFRQKYRLVLIRINHIELWKAVTPTFCIWLAFDVANFVGFYAGDIGREHNTSSDRSVWYWKSLRKKSHKYPIWIYRFKEHTQHTIIMCLIHEKYLNLR